MLSQLVFLILGIAGLWVGSNMLVKGVKDFATAAGLSYFFIGVAFVSIGTSIPEIAVSIAGAVHGLNGADASGIVVGNAIGSALTQVSLFIGILAFLMPLYLTRREVFRHAGMLIAAILLVFGLGVDGSFGLIDGLVMIGAYIAYYLIMLTSEKVTREGSANNLTTRAFRDVLYAVIGLGIVLVCSDIVVDNAIRLTQEWAVSQSLVGVLLVGFGTGLPELSVALASAKQRVMSISVGNLIGSNICDLLLSLGIGTTVAGFTVAPEILRFDIPVLLFLSGVLLLFWYTRQKISKLEGVILVSLYVTYVAIKLFI